MASNAINCFNLGELNVNLTGQTVSVGQIWSALEPLGNPSSAKRICVEMTTTDDPGGTLCLVQQYTDCYDCLSNNYATYNFIDCIGGRTYVVTAEEFGSLPNVNDTFYMTLQRIGKVGVETYTSCFTFSSLKIITQDEYGKAVSQNEFFTVTTTPDLETGCETCLANNFNIYEVTNCVTSEIDYVSLINDSYIGHLISYSDGINQYCGVVKALYLGVVSSFTFINDYGLLDKNGGTVNCDDCLATENDKVLLVSCTDSEITEVVWASALYDGGEVSNLSTDAGCFIVSGLTESGVTINSFLNFDPQPGCEPCIECNGIVYEFAPCGGEGPLYVTSYQYLSGGTYFYNPALDQCCQLVGTASGYIGDDTLYSVDTFTDCTDCETNVDIVIWNASACTASNTYSSFYVTTDSSAIQGDVVKLMWGTNEWICAQLLNTTSSYSGGYSYYNTQDNGSGGTLIYDSCENCNSQGLIGVTLVSCEAPYTEQFVSISLDNYLQIYNFGGLTNYSVSDQQGNCFTITNVCPIPLTEEGFTPVAFYLNCFICSDENPDNPPRSANTENFICIPDCEFTGSTAVTPPHPVWTDGYGTPVTQLNMVVLGGPNGLNA